MTSRLFLTLVGLLFGASCQPASAPSPELLRLELIRPKNADGVYLNEELVFDFSGEIDPLSVTKTSLRIEAENDGSPARGEFLIRGKRIRFLPDPVLDPELQGGGYKPGTRYIVTMRGFPRLDGLRDEKGTPLARTIRWSFTTAEATPLPRTEFIFADSTPESCAPLRLVPGDVAPGQPILIACGEPLDPSSLKIQDFTLKKGDQKISLQVGFLRNEEERAGDPRAGALIQIRPRVLLEGGRYTLRLRNSENSHDLIDFAGNTPRDSEGGVDFDLFVRQRDDAGPSEVLRESFVDESRELPLEILGVDGTAMWSDAGVVTIRYPAAAGDGRDQVFLPEVPGRSDVPMRLQAFRVEIPENANVSMSGSEPGERSGLGLLRAQGKIQIDGRLTRRIAGSVPLAPMTFEPVDEPPFEAADWLAARLSELKIRDEGEEEETGSTDALFRALGEGLTNQRFVLAPGMAGWNSLESEVRTLSHRQGSGKDTRTGRSILIDHVETLPAGEERDWLRQWLEGSKSGAERLTLSDWLDRAEERSAPWTVLIAGGDLVVAKGAVIECDTPLLLCAGGRLRVYGQVRAPEIWVLGEGGGSGLQGRQDAELFIDEPNGNPLVGPLTYAVLSQSLPAIGGPVNWISAQSLGQARGGSYTVSYLRAFDGTRFDPDEHETSYSPALMKQPARIRFLIELTIHPIDKGKDPGLRIWSPPFVDEIVLISENAR